MVTYQKTVKLAFALAGEKTREQQYSTALMSTVSQVWNERKQDLTAATEAQAKQIIRSEIDF